MTADTSDRTSATGPGLLADRYLPTFEVTRIEHVVVDAPPARTWEQLCDLDLMQVHTPLMDVAMWARGLPTTVAGLLGQERPLQPPLPELKLRPGPDGALELPGWLWLGEVDGEQLAFGAIGRFWQPEIDWYDVTGMTPEGFAAFEEPGWGRIAAAFTLRPYGEHRTLASYEARTATPDPESTRRFRRYWRLVDPFVGHIMRATLTTLRDTTERATSNR
jgi:hypothetical protein